MIKQWELIPGLADELLSIRRDSGSLIDSVLAEIGIIQSNILTKVSKSGDTMTGNLILNSTANIATNPKVLSFQHNGIERGYLRYIPDSVSAQIFPELSVRRLLLGGNDGIYSNIGISGGGQSKIYFTNNGETLIFQGQSLNHWLAVQGGSGAVNIGGTLGFTTTGIASGSADLTVVRDAADTLGLRRGSNAQRFNLYGTFTDSSNYRRLYISSTTAGAFTLGVEGLGTGASGNNLSIGSDISGPITVGQSWTISAGSPPQQASSVAGNNLNLFASNAVIAASGNSGANGGNVLIRAGSANRVGIGTSPIGGSVTIIGGSGVAGGASGNVTVQGATGSFASDAGHAYIRGGECTSYNNYLSHGSIFLSTYSGLAYTIPGNIISTVGSGSDDTNSGGSGGAAGYYSISLGSGGGATAGGGIKTGGNGGYFNLTGGAGGISSSSTATTSIGGNGGSLTFTSGAGGNASAGTGTRTGGNSGSIIFNIGAVGVGTTSNGSFGSIIWQQGGTERFRLTSAGLLSLGGTTNLFPAIKQNGTAINFRLADDSADAPITAAGITANGSLQVTNTGGNVFGIIRSGNNIIFDGGWKDTGQGSFLASALSFGYAFDQGFGGIRANTGIGLSNQLSSPYSWTIQCGNGYGVEIGNGTNSGRLSIYNTFTNTSNYIRQSLSFTTYATVVHAQLAAEGLGTGAVNIPFVITPRGTGAFIVGPMPDGTATGGNARGARAVDLQTARSAATQVASGVGAVIFGGSGNTASGGSSGCGGESSIASGYGSFSWGLFTTASATYSVAFARAAAVAPNSFAFGFNARSDRNGQFSHANGSFSTGGDAQRSAFIVRITTTNATPATLLTGNEWGGTATERLTVNAGEILGFIANITGSKSDGSAVAHYVRKGMIKRVGTTTTLVYIETVGTDYEDNAATDVSITADDTNDALQIQVTGIAGETWRWVATIEAADLGFGT